MGDHDFFDPDRSKQREVGGLKASTSFNHYVSNFDVFADAADIGSFADA